MIDVIIAFVTGLFFGTFFGIFIIALMTAAKEDE